ncbi:SNF-related serine/threonine-protein kinase-like [Maniola jurtina]|uniref:SNF-related serine/threonine-protein kinase-like n=1 Tax=Maniola jurtina TaxID=191418 RepID=UPI001E68F277|nr:SNF-related serine/threonine-protein kinase-like [Maniola jurtina]XP_045766900.1 SNF-related serine/threonine-protein kinase-like [Maniola jurtina]XP_045766901.1 SNF-related serine/threonine-protein kinase-like [Maniola jurtina]XP_045766902.1 SNF-related serine/threonine-protein kinase-like [Maniola jurtina]XP_045766903.1 SNF-related serine/threonine-protein kinase-like [Maniola jurtina]XP_045766904.1 SNF-related serine/threonine-protein kinase-like [Maniola jurtina]XP_045766905.1 SNF-rela
MNNCGSGVPITVGAYDTKIAGLYDLLDTLGSGHFAVVKLARHVFTGEKVAVKVIDKSKLDDVSKSHLFQEVRCMKLVQHPNVVRLYEVIDTQTKLYLILELGDGGDLYDYIMRHESGLSESLARDYFRQIVRAISYCHRLHVVHRDLKPENVVFFEKLGVVKLTDFGFSNKFCPGQKLETSCGSLAYSAPEILLGDSYDAPAVDVWSLGVILYMLVCGQAPFQEANDSETLTMIMDCKYTMPAHVSNSCKRLIGRMLVREPEKRATLAEIASDPWITAGEGVTIEDFDTPLVAKQDLTEEDRAAILQRMVNGAIATKEHILEELEKNEYNHITATYYLLAERKLRSKRQEARQSARRPEVLGVSRTSRGLLAPPQLSAAPRTPQDVPPRSRKCSIVREEEDDEEGAVAAPAARSADARRGSRSEGRLHLARPAQLADNLTKVNLDEGASDVTNAATQAESARRAPPAPAPARRQRIECRRRRARAGSCSSSDLSDDDSEKKKRAGEQTPAPGERARRDSHDDSSDSQERGAARRPAPRPPPPAPAPTHGGGSSSGSGGGGGAAGDARGGGAGSAGGRRRRAARKESRLRESRSLNRIAEVEEASAARWAGGGLVALCGRPLLRLLAAARPAPSARRLHGLC